MRMVLPFKTALMGRDSGEEVCKERLVLLNESETSITFFGVNEPPLLSINRDFSAPVVMAAERQPGELERLAEVDPNAFARYEATQELMYRALIDGTRGGPADPTAVINAMRLDPQDPDPVERASYDASYKGVTDILTLYLWRRLAFYLTRWAARAGLSPNMVTGVGAILCVAAFFLFLNGWYWTGIAAGFGFMVLDTVDGKLARCTGQSSYWGNIFDHGVDLVHPPFWWWAWSEGLQAYGRPLERVYELLIVGAIVFGYVAQRVIEGIFMRRFGMHIHVWQEVDSKFRLITARRNPNMVILVVCLAFGRPDLGIELVALWTLVSLIFHAVRLAQANGRYYRGRPVVSWLA